MDTVRLRTASMEWNVPGKYRLIQKEPAIAPNSETFSTFINPGIRTPLFSAAVLKKCALLALHLIAEEEETEMDVMPLIWGKNGKLAAERVQCERVKAKLGRKTKVCSLAAFVKAMCATMRCTSSGCMGPDLSFLAGLGVGKGGTKLHMALDMPCQEMNEAW